MLKFLEDSENFLESVVLGTGLKKGWLRLGEKGERMAGWSGVAV